MKMNMKKKSITMETGKKIVSIAIILAMMAGLSACSGIKDRFISDKEKDRIEVYDKKGKKILDTTEEDSIEFFADIVGKTADKAAKKDLKDFLKKVPKDAKVSYRYVFSSKRAFGKKTGVTFIVYDNYPLISAEGLPFIKRLTWKLSKRENLKLQNPN